MLTGKLDHTLDSKNRITIPAKHREALGATCMLVMGTLGNLMLFPLARWEQMIRDINERPIEERNELRDYAFSVSAEVTPDSQGRIVIPQSHIEYAQIKSNVTIIGNDEYDAIWASEVWEARFTANKEDRKQKLRSIGF